MIRVMIMVMIMVMFKLIMFMVMSCLFKVSNLDPLVPWLRPIFENLI